MNCIHTRLLHTTCDPYIENNIRRFYHTQRSCRHFECHWKMKFILHKKNFKNIVENIILHSHTYIFIWTQHKRRVSEEQTLNLPPATKQLCNNGSWQEITISMVKAVKRVLRGGDIIKNTHIYVYKCTQGCFMHLWEECYMQLHTNISIYIYKNNLVEHMWEPHMQKHFFMNSRKWKVVNVRVIFAEPL